MLLLTSHLTALVTLLLPLQEKQIPAFDHKDIAASYVISAPDPLPKGTRLPLILDFHGAIAPSAKGAMVTQGRLWSKFVEEVPCIVAAPNGRTRAWGMIRGNKDDKTFALAILAEVRKRYPIDPTRIYVAGFSSGADWLCKGGVQLAAPVAGSLVTCPGPSNVVGLRGGELLKVATRPFYLVAGEEDYIRKDGAWSAFLALDQAGRETMYREVPDKAHEFYGMAEYARLFAHLEAMVRGLDPKKLVGIAELALQRGDYLMASTYLLRIKATQRSKALLTKIEDEGKRSIESAKAINTDKEVGRAYEAWWRIMTQFHRYPEISKLGKQGMAALDKKVKRRDLYRARRDWFRNRAQAPVDEGSKKRPVAIGRGGLFGFDRYLTYDEITKALQQLARRHPDRARLRSLGRSHEGRDIWLLTVTDFEAGKSEHKPAAWLQGGIHGNEISSSMAVLYTAWQLVADPERSRGNRRILRDKTLYLVPAVNPDAVHHYLAEAQSSWRPRFNASPYDSDGDGKVDEDPYEDLDKDGEIGLMYAPDPKGPYVVKNGYMVRSKGTPRYRLVAREGVDNDEDGKYSEDGPGGVNLNRNFPVGHRPGKNFGGSRGKKPGSEPETRAIMQAVAARPNIALFIDYHNDADCTFSWLGPEAGGDEELQTALATRAQQSLGYTPKMLRHAGAGLAIAWTQGELGIPSLLIELEATRGDKKQYYKQAYAQPVMVPVRPFDHPQLGAILLGNHYRKLPRRNLHPRDLFWQVDRNFAFIKDEVGRLPQLALIRPGNPKIVFRDGRFEVSGTVLNRGAWPTDTARARKLGKAPPIRLSAEGARISGTLELTGLGPGETRPFEVRLDPTAESITLHVHHARGGRVSLPIRTERSATIPIRKDYRVQPGYATSDEAIGVDNATFDKGRARKELGPRFELKLHKDKLRVGVILAEWADERHSVSKETYEEQFFSLGKGRGWSPTGQHAYGSVRDFYREMSYGRFDVTGKVFDWVTLPGKWIDYRKSSFGSQKLVARMIEAIEKRDGPKALEGFDCLALVWAGNSVERGSMLWPMRVTLSRVRKDMADVVAFKMGEFHHGEAAPIGVACHELAHCFGVNDKYGLGSGKGPLGPWCLIALGTNGGAPSGRHRPFPLCAWCKLHIGWVEPRTIDAAVPQKLALRPINFAPGECYRILLDPEGREYLLLENRRREGFQSTLPSPGLVIYKVGPPDKPASPQVRVQLLPAHGLPTPGRGILQEPGSVAWPQAGKTSFHYRHIELSDIRLVDDVVYFRLARTRHK